MVVGDSLGGSSIVQFLSKVDGSVVGDSLGEQTVWLLEIFLGKVLLFDFCLK